MDSDTPLDCAVFELSPRRSRCELFVSGNGRTEKIASGFLKPFLTHLKVAEEQAACSDEMIKLEVDGSTSGHGWFNKGTLERFVRFVSTPEVLESAITCDAEISQLEGARRIYSQGIGNTLSCRPGEDVINSVEDADVTKNELLRAIDLRLVTLKQDLAKACARACSAGFSIDNVSELLLFAEYFGAIRLIEACNKFIFLCQKYPDLIAHQSQSLHQHLKSFADKNLCSSSSSDMSTDEPELQVGASKPPVGGDPQDQKPNSQTLRTVSTVFSGATQQAMSILRQKAVSEEPISSASSANEPSRQDGGGSRRLSVQDRINMFESKQKEQSANSGNIISAGANRVISGKGHRRLSSDVSEKSVLRRWSGASDMSIDLTSSTSNSMNDVRGSGSTVETPTSTNLQLPLRNKTEETKAAGLRDTVTSQCWLDQRTTDTSPSLHSEDKGFSGDGDRNKDEGVRSSINKKRPDVEKGKHCVSASTGQDEQMGIDNKNCKVVHQKTLPVNRNDTDSLNLAISTLQSEEGNQFQMKDQITLLEVGQTRSIATEQLDRRDQEIAHPWTRETLGTDGAGTKNQAKLGNQSSTSGRRTSVEVKAKGPFGSQVQLKVLSSSHSESDLQTSQTQGKTLPVKMEEAGARNVPASHVTSRNSLVKTKEYAYSMDKKNQQKLSVCETNIEELKNNETNSVPALLSRNSKKTQNVVEPPSTHHKEQLQVMKQSKGNQDLNDELRTKANELEKLFAAHKLRTAIDQTANNRRSTPVEFDDQVPVAMDKRHAMIPPDHLLKKSTREISEKEMETDATFLKPMADKKDYGSANEKFDNFSSSNDSRGKLYYAYTQKRDAKLVVESQTKRAQKEAKMKAMRDSLEHSQAEMNSRYTVSAARQVSKKKYLWAEKVGSFGKRQNEAVESVAEEEEDVDKLYDQGQHTSYNDLFANNHFKSTKLLPNKALSCSTPRTTVISNPKPSVKSAKLVSTKNRSQTENPLSESLPNFTDFRKENTKPSTAINRVNKRERIKILSRSKSIVEETNHVMEDKSHRFLSMRNSAAMPGELEDLSLLNSDIPDTALTGFDKPHADTVFTNEAQKSKELKLFVRKGKGAAPSSGISISNPKASVVSGIIQQGNSPDLDKDTHERSSAQEDPEPADYLLDADSEKLRCSQEYENSDDFGSEDGDFQSLSQVDYSTAPVSPNKHSAGNAEVPPGESPRSWNFNVHPEASDIDVCADSPIGSPASWTLNPLNPLEADAAWMRKKWGSAHMPLIAAHASQQSRKDVTKGFKRLLKFGRKSRGAETLVSDWVSASTASEGDDDTEDGRDVTNRPTEDLRKSRMGYPLVHDGFNEGEMFSERAESLRSSIQNPPANFKLREDHLGGGSLKAPRSLFSLSSFRSKETKLR
ncbi:uncharacterized protein LOC121975930 isoform X1 [Zingiber officinale]|uniref:uncharacterized protein LOC121975930 isoform X1 n=1 Tax=Zingiber officinale TaxID=94328 RepID=UPI001C4B779B|nr:uncharacterized protein LOC121975930 isoform X1 [Zingiber officinale]XP_042383798.1 uncharacterized protein LOC121975930 isoform X1 [Zingiber officinale]XP_042383799.1 uncharacterized protein LOC121975930 isoform X1 [Zingiber officinale]